MPDPGPGSLTFYYTNEQSARLMFYHDHAYGITRLNVYAGEAASYLLTDQVEADLIDGTNVSGGNPGLKKVLPNLGGLYRYGIPLVIQDKTFVTDATTPPGTGFPVGATPTPLTAAVDPLWYTHLPGSTGGNLWLPHEYMPNENIYDPNGFDDMGRWDYGPWMSPPMIPLNLTLPSPCIVAGSVHGHHGGERHGLPVPGTAADRGAPAHSERLQRPDAQPPVVQGRSCQPDGSQDGARRPQSVLSNLARGWTRAGGVPDPTTAGPSLIQIGNECGFLVQAAVTLPQPLDFDYNRRSITFGSVTSRSLLLPPAVRSDVVVDLSGYKDGDTLILYNDAPAPMPLYDTRYDYFANDPDQTAIGGAPLPPPVLVPVRGPSCRSASRVRPPLPTTWPRCRRPCRRHLPRARTTS